MYSRHTTILKHTKNLLAMLKHNPEVFILYLYSAPVY